MYLMLNVNAWYGFIQRKEELACCSFYVRNNGGSERYGDELVESEKAWRLDVEFRVVRILERLIVYFEKYLDKLKIKIACG